MWLPTKYWIFLIISLKNASALRRISHKVTSNDEVSSSRSPLQENQERNGTLTPAESTIVDYEIVGPAHSKRSEDSNGPNEKFSFRQSFSKRERGDASSSRQTHKNTHGPDLSDPVKPSRELPPRKDRGMEYYSNEMNKYVKHLFSVSLGTLLSSLNAPKLETTNAPNDETVNDSQDIETEYDEYGDATVSESQAKVVLKEDSNEQSAPVANSLLSKINKGLNYTSTISKYLSSMPAVRSLTSTFTGAVSSVQDYFKLIKPGTQWCGDGDRAKSYEDLGLFYKTDACCREHDICPEFILSGAEKHGLKNDGVFTKLHCDCDVRFYQCLKSVHTPIALSTGFEYFNILKPTCFKKEYPVIGCNAFNKGKCVQYKLDSNHERIWQWFENKEFL